MIEIQSLCSSASNCLNITGHFPLSYKTRHIFSMFTDSISCFIQITTVQKGISGLNASHHAFYRTGASS